MTTDQRLSKTQKFILFFNYLSDSGGGGRGNAEVETLETSDGDLGIAERATLIRLTVEINLIVSIAA